MVLGEVLLKKVDVVVLLAGRDVYQASGLVLGAFGWVQFHVRVFARFRLLQHFHQCVFFAVRQVILH